MKHLLVAAAAVFAVPAAAHHVEAHGEDTFCACEILAEQDGLILADGVARAAGPVARTGAGYLNIKNGGAAADRLVGAETSAAQRVEIHTHLLENGVARMVAVEGGVEIPAGGTAELAQGGYHLMFMGLAKTWREASEIPVTLLFERAGRIDVSLPLETGTPSAGGRGSHDGEHGAEGTTDAHGSGH